MAWISGFSECLEMPLRVSRAVSFIRLLQAGFHGFPIRLDNGFNQYLKVLTGKLILLFPNTPPGIYNDRHSLYNHLRGFMFKYEADSPEYQRYKSLGFKGVVLNPGSYMYVSYFFFIPF